jgi:hypothetical protein
MNVVVRWSFAGVFVSNASLRPFTNNKEWPAESRQNPLRKTIRNPGTQPRSAHIVPPALLLAIAALAAINPAVASAEATVLPRAVPATPSGAVSPAPERLLVIGFMGGRIHADNLAHGEARLARDLDQQYPGIVHAITFANHREHEALRTLLDLLDTSRNGRLSQAEKNAARIVLFGHSWGASEAIQLARELDRRGIPVLLTIQVDSVEKSGEDDRAIPPNVHEAINFYQTEGLLHGRQVIQAVDPKRTTILGSYKSSYKSNPVPCDGYGWFARTFMKPHIEIENDRALWGRIEALIVARSCALNSVGMSAACTEK